MFYKINNIGNSIHCANYEFENNCLEYSGLTMEYYEQNKDKYKIIDGILTDITSTTEYKSKIKKQKKNNAYKAYQEGLIKLKSEDELNQFLKSCGKITQSEYDSRLAIITTDLTALQSTYSTEVADD